MVKTEFFRTREDGVDLYISYSDKGFCLKHEGTLYAHAIDPADCIREYEETDVPSGVPAETEDYQNALRELGVEV